MAGIFISYRRADSDGWAGRLRDTLRVRFGNRVFQDVESIADGEIFSEVIDRALQECDVALIIIGPNWASAANASGRRLDQHEDWVRTETSLVLQRKIRVIPVLVGGASMPRAEDLPEDLRSLTRRQAREIRSNSWDSDVGLLTNHLRQIVDQKRRRPAWHYAAASLALVAIGVFAGSQWLGQRESAPAPAERVAAVPAAAPAAAPPADAKRAAAADAAPAIARSESATQKPVADARPGKEKPPPPEAPAARVKPAAPEAPVASSKPAPTRAEAPRAKAAAVAPPQEPRRPAAADPAPASDRLALSAPVAPASPVAPKPALPAAPAAAPAAAKPAQVASLNLPNRPASARELRIGDSWTYRLREARFDRNLATVTHEISGGDKGGIREIVRIGARKSADNPDEATAGSARRLPLEPRIFERPVSNNATLFEFAPFMAAFSELQPGVTWKQIAGARSSDAINSWRFSGKVTGRERVRVPAGSFEAIKAELEGELHLSAPSTRDPSSETEASYQKYAVWFAPEVGRAIKYERLTYNRGGSLLDHEQYELVSYKLQ